MAEPKTVLVQTAASTMLMLGASERLRQGRRGDRTSCPAQQRF